jgi:hypothetical protein
MEHLDECRAYGHGLIVPPADVRLVARVVFAMRGSIANRVSTSCFNRNLLQAESGIAGLENDFA